MLPPMSVPPAAAAPVAPHTGTTRGSARQRLAGWIRGPRGQIFGLALAHMAAATWVLTSREVVDDEGYLAFTGARLWLDAPLAAFFALKLHPVVSVLQAPWAALGWRAWLVGHVLTGGLAVALLGSAVRRFGGRGPLAALLLAASPALVVASAAGQSNVDGLLLVCAALYAAARAAERAPPPSPVGASAARPPGAWVPWAGVLGVLLSLCPWARVETVLGAFALGVFALWRLPTGRRALAVGAALFPLAYGVGGALYHGDALFVLHYPPSVPQGVPLNESIYDFPATLADSAASVARNLAWVCGAWPLIFARGWSRLPAMGRLGLALSVGVTTAMTLVPLTGGFFDFPWPRYLLVLLPWLALTVGLAVRHRTLARVVVALTLVTAGWTLSTPQRHWRLGFVAPTEAEAQALRVLRGGVTAGRVFTTNMRVALALQQDSERTPGRPQVVFLPGHDVQLELFSLLNHANGQFDALTRSFARVFLGRTVWTCALPDLALTTADRLVVGADPRRTLLLPDAVLAAVADPGPRFGDELQLWRPRGGRLQPRWPPPLPPRAMRAFCAAPAAVGP